MNNTKTITLGIAAIFIAVTLVVGGTFAATSAFAYVKKGPQPNATPCNTEGSNAGFVHATVESGDPGNPIGPHGTVCIKESPSG